MPFINGRVAGGAVDFAGRGVDHAGHPRRAGRVQHMERAQHIGLYHIGRMLVGIGDGDQRAQVEQAGAARDGNAHRIWVFQIACYDFDGCADRRWQRL